MKFTTPFYLSVILLLFLSSSLSAQQNCNSFKADFKFAPDTLAVQSGVGTIKLTNTSTYFDSSNVSYKWTYGVGSFSNDSNKIHGYTFFFIPATFNVCLIATLINNGDTCRDSTCKSVYVENCFIRADYTIAKDTSCFIYTFTSARPANTYDWSFGDGTNSNLKSVRHIFTSTGEHNVCLIVTDTLQSGIICSDVKCQTITICKDLNVPNLNAETKVKVYPNPIGSTFFIETSYTKPVQYFITDVLGRTIMQGSFTKNISINVSDLKKGNYFLELRDKQKVVFRQKISK